MYPNGTEECRIHCFVPGTEECGVHYSFPSIGFYRGQKSVGYTIHC